MNENSTKSHNVERMMGSETDDIIKNIFNLFCKNIKKISRKMRGSELVFDSTDLFYYLVQKTSLKRRGRSYIASPKLLKN